MQQFQALQQQQQLQHLQHQVGNEMHKIFS
jgi:hypothetical protein